MRLGVFDATLPPIVTIESGDEIRLPNTWSHFMNELQPGVPISRLAELRTSNPRRGPHSPSISTGPASRDGPPSTGNRDSPGAMSPFADDTQPEPRNRKMP